MKKAFLLTALILFINTSLIAQIIISGTVTELMTGEPLPGATVSASDESGEIYAEVQCDFDGIFSIEVKNTKSILSFAFIGMLSEAVLVGNKDKIDAALVSNPDAMEEVVVIGYGGMSSAEAKTMMREEKRNFKKIIAGNFGLINLVLSDEKAKQYSLLMNENFEEVKLNDIDTLFSCPPTGLNQAKDLTSGSKKFCYTRKENIKSEAKILTFFKIKHEQGKIYSVSDFVQYKDVLCPEAKNKFVRYAVGVRLKLTVSDLKVDLDTNIPAYIALAAQMGQCEATYEIETIGFANEASRDAMSKLGGGSFNAESYIDMRVEINKLIESIESDTNINPRMIPFGDGT